MFRRLISVFMITLLLCIAPAATIPVTTPAVAEVTEIPEYRPRIFMNFSHVRKLLCGTPGEKNWGRGTGVVIGETTIMTAAHVTVGDICIDEYTGIVVRPFAKDATHDIAFAAFEGPPFKHAARINCKGLIGGENYSAFGFMLGDELVETRLIASGIRTSLEFMVRDTPGPLLHLLGGDIFPGMSGGPILDQDGAVVAINSATNGLGIGLARELRDTILCDPKHVD